ncbi:MAG: DUF5658 family protein [Patescibacteria group bacterium]|jgi:hypothetical protein
MQSANAWEPPSRIVLALCAVLLMQLHVFDLLATIDILRHGGREINPVMRAWFAHSEFAGSIGKMMLAVCLTVALAVLTRAAPHGYRRTFWRLLLTAIIIQTLVMCWHLYLLAILPLL